MTLANFENLKSGIQSTRHFPITRTTLYMHPSNHFTTSRTIPTSFVKTCGVLLPVLVVLSSCNKPEIVSDSKEQNIAEQSSSESTDSKESALKKSSEVRARIAAGLKSFYHVGEEVVEIQKINDKHQRAILRIPIIVSEDLYKENQSGIYRTIEKVKDKGAEQSVVFILTGTHDTGGWSWNEQIEENVEMDTSFLPRSRFPQEVMLKDSEEHLNRIKSDAKLSEEADAAKAEKLAKTRQEKIAPLAAVLKLNSKSIGTINGGNYQFVVTEADLGVPYWTVIASKVSSDRKKVYDQDQGNGPITISYDEKQEACIVAEVQARNNSLLRGAVVVVTADGLTFKGPRLEVTPPGFRFE